MTDETRELAALAERVEAATGGDRCVDLGIFAALWPEKFDDADTAALYGRAWKRPGGWTLNRADWCYVRDLGVPAYTASLDAAMTLVPEGCRFEVTTTGYKPGASVTWYDPTANAEDAYAATPALALCAAALRARIALSGTGESR